MNERQVEGGETKRGNVALWALVSQPEGFGTFIPSFSSAASALDHRQSAGADRGTAKCQATVDQRSTFD
jgi:hypothetical protein